MKIFKLPQLAEISGLAEYVLSAGDSSATALRWGRLLPKETGRKIAPAGTDAEIVYIVKGRLSVKRGKSAFPVSDGEAFFINGAADMELDNAGDADAVYIVAGHRYQQEKADLTGAESPSADAKAEQPPAPQSRSSDDELEITKDDPDDEGGHT